MWLKAEESSYTKPIKKKKRSSEAYITFSLLSFPPGPADSAWPLLDGVGEVTWNSASHKLESRMVRSMGRGPWNLARQLGKGSGGRERS